jgi:hypothetical protein
LWLACAGDETYVPQPIGADSGWTAGDGGGDGGADGELCSDPATGPAATLRVRNQGNLPVQVLWVDTSCTELSYAELLGGQSYDQPTYVNHAWRVRVLGSGELLAELLVDETLELVEVSP